MNTGRRWSSRGNSPTDVRRAASPVARSPGPDREWRDELGRDEAFALVDQIRPRRSLCRVRWRGAHAVPYFWDIFRALSAAGVSIKIETNGRQIDAAAAARLHDSRRRLCADFLDGRDGGDA